MPNPSVWARRLWPLLIVLNSSACGEGGSCGVLPLAGEGSTSTDAADFFFTAKNPMQYCCDQNTPRPVTVGTIQLSLIAESTISFYVRPRTAPVQYSVQETDALGIPHESQLAPGEEIEVRGRQPPVTVTIQALDCVHTILEFDVFRHAEADPDHPDRTVGAFVESVEIVPIDCPPGSGGNVRTATCAATEAVTKAVHQGVEAIGIAG
ncbi:MAG TPA: hypothetical protein VIH00_04405, partial [Candidatus Limnocylindrales bacterium]